MAQQLKNILSFTLAPGAEVVLPHGLQLISGTPLAPDIIFIPSESLSVTSDTVNVTLTNDGGIELAGAVLVEAWHTIERAFGDDNEEDLPVKPYVVVSVEQGNAPPWPPFPLTDVPVTTTIYVRPASQGGDDTSGKGTLAKPYLTFQRAIRDVPLQIPSGTQFNVDVTGIMEAFPPGYQMPQIQSSSLMYNWYDNDGTPFAWSTPLNIIATPQPANISPLSATILTAADYTVSADPDTNLATLTLTGPARVSWAGNALKGKMLIGTGGQSSVRSIASCVIYESDSVGPLTYIKVTNDAGNVDGNLQIVEPSATFQSSELSAGQAFWQGSSFQCIGCSAVAFQGIKFVNTDADQYASALSLSGVDLPIIELCDVGGLTAIRCMYGVELYESVVHSAGKVFAIEPAAVDGQNSLILDVPTWFILLSGLSLSSTVIDNCAPLSVTTFVNANGGFANSWELKQCLIQNGQGPGGIWARAGNTWSLEDVSIRNTVVGDGILAEGTGVNMVLNHVTGTGNAGVGVRLNDGASVRVIDDGTVITGTVPGSDIAVGVLPVRTWVDFRGFAPVKNQYDLVGMNAGATDQSTGSRLFQRT